MEAFKAFILYFFCLVQSACSDSAMFGHSPFVSGPIFPTNWVVLEYTPLEKGGFCYSPLQGIDSFVGSISKDSLKFTFDFGWYSSDGILSKTQLKETLIRNRKYFLNDCGLDNRSTTNLQRNLSIEKVNPTDSLFENGPSIEIMCHDTYCIIDGSRYRPSIKKLDQYRFEELEFYGMYSKIYYPKGESNQKEIGLYIGPTEKISKSVIQKLNINSYDYSPKEQKEMLNYLRSARDAFIEENKNKLD